MKLSLAILAVLLTLAAAGCGGESGAADQGSDDLQAKVEKFLAAPRVDPPSGPPPKQVEVKDLRVGSGPAAKTGDRVVVYFRGFYYRTGEEYCFEWRPGPPIVYRELGGPIGERGLQQGIVGMKAGGRREVTVPERLGSTDDALIYVAEVVSVKPAGRSSGADV